MKSFLKKIKIKHIDVFIYKLPSYELNKFEKDMSSFTIKTENGLKRDVFSILNSENQLVHRSLVYKKVHLLKLIGVKGHVVGGCMTHVKYRGQGFYPLMLNTIGATYFEAGNFNLFIIVDKTNLSSIRGIEKAGFKKMKEVNTKRIGPFYFDTYIV